MKHNVDKMMDGLANLALGHAELKERVDQHRDTIDHNAIDAEQRLSKLEAAQKATDDKVVTLQLTERVARYSPAQQSYPPPEPPTKTLTDGDCWAIGILYCLVILDILIHLFK